MEHSAHQKRQRTPQASPEPRTDQVDTENRRDSGAAMVEMAFIFGLLVMLLVGVVTSAIAFGQKNAIENAAREASRYAATLVDVGSNLDAVIEVAQSAAHGNLDTGVDGMYICVSYAGNIAHVGAGSPTGPNCYDDGLNLPDPRVQVFTQRDTTINAALFSIDVTLSGSATALYERG